MSKNKIVDNMIWKIGERTINQLMSFVVSMVLARLLVPDDYGVISLVTSFFVILEVLLSNGFGSSLVQKENSDELDFSSVLVFNLILSPILYLVVFFAAPYVSTYYKQPILTSVMRVLGLKIIISSIANVQDAYVSKNMIFKKYFWSTLWGNLFSGIFGIILAYLGFGVWALVCQMLVNALVNSLVLSIIIGWHPSFKFSINRLRPLFSFGWKILFEGLSNSIASQLQNLIIGKVYTSTDLGFYSRGQQFPELILNNLSYPLSSVLFPAMSLEQSVEGRVKQLLRKSTMLSSYLLFPMLVGLAVVAKPMVSVLLTDKWLGCVPFLQISCFVSAATVGIIPRHQAMKSIGRSDVYMVEHIIARVIGLILLFCVYKISVMAIALTGILSTIVLFATVMYTSKKYNNYKYFEQIKDVTSTLILCLCMGVPVYFIPFLISLSSFWILVIQIFAGIIIYVSLSILFKVEGFKYTIKLVRILLHKDEEGGLHK